MFSLLITPEQWLKRSQEPDWALFDCHFDLTNPGLGIKAYRTAHLPGAQYAHLEDDLAGLKGPGSGRHPLPDPQRLAEKFGSWGIGPDTQVVCYDNQGGAIAARMWWLLRWLGHERVAVLEGGWRQWIRVEYPTSKKIPQPQPTCFTPRPRHTMMVTTEELESHLKNGGYRLLDARSEERFNGEVEPLDPVAGHIPGAVNTPFPDNLDNWGNFLPRETLRRYYQKVLTGTDPEQSAAMCGSGVTACHTLLAMELAGLHGAKLYPGSWSEWVQDPGRPVATAATS